MPRRSHHGLLERLGRVLINAPAVQLFVLSILGLFIFAGVTLVGVNAAFDKLADKYESQKAAGAGDEEQEDFHGMVMKATVAAYDAFIRLSLGKKNFISKYEAPREAGDRQWSYSFWELAVPDDFVFDEARSIFAQNLRPLGRAVHYEAQELDTKTFFINIDIEGLNTHRVFFTRTGAEIDKDVPDVLAMKTPEIPKVPAGAPRVAIIIDDIGHREFLEQRLLMLDAPLTFSVLPHSPYGREFAEKALRAGREVMLHIPMEPKDPNIKPGAGGLFVHMNDDEIRRIAADDLRFVPGVRGVNNHMGSRFTSDAEKMRVVLDLVRSQNLYFVDSWTAGTSQGYKVAKEMGLATARRNVFLDHDPGYDSILRQFDALARMAKKQGEAIAIGHPNTNTLQALRVKLPELVKAGIHIVPPSQLVKKAP
ncbi:divergent polysaccharide deacetylase family protein [bacterium]|nr:divergent polysaccharide deacetylase family protein [bacterium]